MTKTCSIEGCDREAKITGKCQRCYYRAWTAKKKAERPVQVIPEPVREHTTEELLALMDPAWYVPEWNVKKGKLPSKQQILARHRLVAFWKATGWPIAQIGRLVEWKGYELNKCIRRPWYYFPSVARARMIHAALDAYESGQLPSGA